MLNTSELRKYAKTRKLGLTKRECERLRTSWTPTSVRRYSKARASKFQTVQIPVLSQIQIDFANFLGSHKRLNDGAIGFLMAVNEAGFINPLPLRGLKMSNFEDALETLARGSSFESISVLVSDRESAIWSEGFQAKMRSAHGIGIHFMTKGSKAWRAGELEGEGDGDAPFLHSQTDRHFLATFFLKSATFEA